MTTLGGLYVAFVAPLAVLIGGVLGLVHDKQKLLALIMTLIGAAWAAFIGWQFAADIFKSC
ncbi:MAG: hypothetical protein IH624_00730 [Phycisphaerae bacterium]|nr:hypothetical protein [Phycisphaerae bacterium]